MERLSTAGGRDRWTPAGQLNGCGFGPVSLPAGPPAAAGREAVLAVRAASGDARVVRDGRVVEPAARSGWAVTVDAAVHGGATGPAAAAAATVFAVGRPALLGPDTDHPLLVSFGLDGGPVGMAGHALVPGSPAVSPRSGTDRPGRPYRVHGVNPGGQDPAPG